ncbi:DNA-binding transcriptional regulator of glucitol operon [Geomicrobium halophilum]|uniref:DNA-binding transcriptional regulator of glucitol operon n=1 Tax=Geomicrobium halophilum TaxID=549000 RepID=A0A841Q0L1_9BACL|nr:transcriptional regulator GutM [Geomicrobium halophilum]MBB6451112.1 DNA-binding transcriptional regulator of glucitol operon [Geomicrobium halophilum]
MTLIFIGLALGIAFLIQSALGFWQIKNFNQRYAVMRSEGKVAIGRSRGLFRSGVVLLLSVDNSAKIIRAEKMQGLTIFARFKPVYHLENQYLLKTEEDVERKLDRFSKKALNDARHVYRVVKAGGEVPKPKSPFEKLFSGVTRLFTGKREVND